MKENKTTSRGNVYKSLPYHFWTFYYYYYYFITGERKNGMKPQHIGGILRGRGRHRQSYKLA
jgi:hypothetical protein